MYSDYFGLSDSPFALSPDPRYLFMSKRHQEALAHLLFGVKEGGGFVQLTGEVGTGKTTLIRALLEQLDENVEVALILNPRLTAFEFVASLCDDLHIHYPEGTSSLKVLVNQLNDFLLRAHAQQHRVILIVDEAQNFQTDVLEQIRLLTNLETTKQKLLQIILVGQPELRDLLSTTNMRQLAQRVTARYHLVAMTDEEARGYIQHRLRVAGASHPLFTEGAIKQVIKLSKGVPRLINIICDRALLGAYSKNLSQVQASIVKHATREVKGQTDLPRNNGKWVVVIGVLSVVAAIFLVWQLKIFDFESKNVVEDSPVLLAKAEPAKIKVESTLPSLEEISSFDADSQDEIEIVDEPQGLHQQLLASELENRLTQAVTMDLNKAFFNLFTRWDLDYSSLSGTTACERATSARLRCYWSSGSWAEFLALNRPALVWFGGKGEAIHYLAVIAIIDDYAEISVGGEEFTVSLNDLESIWPSQYLVLWRPPALGIGVIRPGDSGEVVLWLRRSLDMINGVKPRSENAHIFDQTLMRKIKAFQSAHDLKVDGLAGSRTMMYLNVALGDTYIPFLKIDQ